jgi:hypothetical protein
MNKFSVPQLCANWIRRDIPTQIYELFLTSHEMIKTVLLPKATTFARQKINETRDRATASRGA